MGEARSDDLNEATTDVAAIEDPAARYLAAREERAKLAKRDRELLKVQQGAVNELYAGRTWAEVGATIGVSGSRAEAIAKGRYTKADHASESTPPDIEPR